MGFTAFAVAQTSVCATNRLGKPLLDFRVAKLHNEIDWQLCYATVQVRGRISEFLEKRSLPPPD
jgi:hypothetical protein